jgi:hypothetical protein
MLLSRREPLIGFAVFSIRLNAPFQARLADSITLPIAPIRMARSRDKRTLAPVGERAGQGAILDLTTKVVRPADLEHGLAGSFRALFPESLLKGSTRRLP